MISDYYSFLFGGGLFALAYFYVNPNYLKNLTTNISWYSVKTYHTFCLYFNDFNETNVKSIKNIDSDDEEEEKINTITIEGLNEDNQIEKFKVAENEDISDINIDDLEILFIKHECDNKIYYENINDLQTIFENNLNIVKRQFLQIELEQDDEKIDIHEHISKYYVENNELFSKTFVKYYLRKYYKKDLNETYKINIIDKNIKLISINEKQWITLTKEGYKIN